MLQIFNEFVWLVHVGILDGVLKIKFKAFVEQQQTTEHNVFIYFLGKFFKNWIKKKSSWFALLK